MRATDGVEQLLRAQALADIDLVSGRTQAVEAGFGDLLRDEDASHPAILSYEGRRIGTGSMGSAGVKPNSCA